MTRYLNEPLNAEYETWENFNRDLNPQGCFNDEDLKDTLTREEFMDALDAQLRAMLPMQTGRHWRIFSSPKGGSWLCAGPEGHLLQITYREKTKDAPGELKVMIRVSTPELNLWMNGLLDEEGSLIYLWQCQHKMNWCINEWADAIDLDLFTNKNGLGVLKGGRAGYPDTWAMPSGTMALGWIHDGMIQPMTAKQLSWTARCIGQLAASMLYIKSMLRSAASESPIDTFPCHPLGVGGFYDKHYRGHPVLRDHLGRYYYDEKHGNIRIHLHWLLSHNLQKPRIRRGS